MNGSALRGVVFFFLLGSPTAASAQHYLEARLAHPTYRYVDWNYTFSSAVVVDLFYVGVPGSNELNLGGGYGFKPASTFTVAPLVYAVFADEGDQRGVKIAVLAAFEKDGWKASAFLAHFERMAGAVEDYQVLDSLDATRTIGPHFELGISGGFFRAGGEWNALIGPLARWNDDHGYWALSYRFGDDNELRAARVFIPKPKPAP